MPHPTSRLAVILVLAYSVVCTQAAHGNDCKIPTLSGEYGLAINGYISFSTASAPLPLSEFSPIAVSGTVRYASSGKVNRSVQVNVGGAVFPVVDSGTYVQNTDCTFTITHGNGEIWTVTPVKHGEELEFSVLSVPGAAGVGAGTMVRKDKE